MKKRKKRKEDELLSRLASCMDTLSCMGLHKSLQDIRQQLLNICDQIDDAIAEIFETYAFSKARAFFEALTPEESQEIKATPNIPGTSKLVFLPDGVFLSPLYKWQKIRPELIGRVE